MIEPLAVHICPDENLMLLIRKLYSLIDGLFDICMIMLHIKIVVVSFDTSFSLQINLTFYVLHLLELLKLSFVSCMFK